jgi:hypothetical protein
MGKSITLAAAPQMIALRVPWRDGVKNGQGVITPVTLLVRRVSERLQQLSCCHDQGERPRILDDDSATLQFADVALVPVRVESRPRSCSSAAPVASFLAVGPHAPRGTRTRPGPPQRRAKKVARKLGSDAAGAQPANATFLHRFGHPSPVGVDVLLGLSPILVPARPASLEPLDLEKAMEGRPTVGAGRILDQGEARQLITCGGRWEQPADSGWPRGC